MSSTAAEPALSPDAQRVVLDAFARALLREAHNLSPRPDLLWQQLSNRLQWEDAPVTAIVSVERQRRSALPGALWLRSRTPFRESAALVREFVGHRNVVKACTFSPDGSLLASASLDGTLKLWDPASGEERATLAGHGGEVLACAFSPDGSLLASLSMDRTLKVRDAVSGEERVTMPGPVGFLSTLVSACAFSPDGSKWEHPDLADTCVARPMPWTALAFSPDGSMLASARKDGTFELWDWPEWASGKGRPRRTLKRPWRRRRKGHQYVVFAFAFSPDGSLLAAARGDGTLTLWDATSGTARATLDGHRGKVLACAFSPEGSLLASASSDGTLKLWDPARRKERATLTGHGGEVLACAFSPDGSLLASASADRTLKLWHVERSAGTTPARQWRQGHAGPVNACAFSPDGSLIASGGEDGALKLWDPARGEERATLGDSGGEVLACAFSSDGSLLAPGSDPRALTLWDPAAGEERATIAGPGGCVTALAFSPDGSLLAAASKEQRFVIPDLGDHVKREEGGLRLWNVATDRSWSTSLADRMRVNACAFSPDGSLLVSAGEDRTLTVWAPVIEEEEEEPTLQERATSAGITLPSGIREDASGRRPRPLRFEKRSTLDGHRGEVLACAFSPDGSLLASGGNDGIVKLWDSARGEERATLAHGGWVTACAFSPDGSLLASASGDRMVTLWQVENGEKRAVLPCAGEARCVALDPRRPLAAYGDSAGGVHLVELVGVEYGPLIVTAVDRGRTLTVRCPECLEHQPLEARRLGQVVDCERPSCEGRMRVNPFVIDRPQRTILDALAAEVTD